MKLFSKKRFCIVLFIILVVICFVFLIHKELSPVNPYKKVKDVIIEKCESPFYEAEYISISKKDLHIFSTNLKKCPLKHISLLLENGEFLEFDFDYKINLNYVDGTTDILWVYDSCLFRINKQYNFKYTVYELNEEMNRFLKHIE